VRELSTRAAGGQPPGEPRGAGGARAASFPSARLHPFGHPLGPAGLAADGGPAWEQQSRQAEGAASRTAVGEGEVIAAVPNSGQIVLEHGEIKGFMEAMTMGYRIDPPSLLAKVKPGDKVRFTIDVERRAIIEIETLR
jgi:Cu/Ag efflux protein CusF